jgi:hypothetical protein
MVLPFRSTLPKGQRFGRVALTALAIGLGGAALATLPLGHPAFAEKGGNGKGGGNDGGHSHDGGKGGNEGDHGGGKNDGSGGNGKSGIRGDDDSDAGPSGADDTRTATEDDSATDDGSLAPSKLGKLNGFFHASPNGLAHASPNSAIGRISHTFKDAVSDFAEANATPPDPNDPNAPPPRGPSVDDLGGILAGATNKTVTGAQVKAIIDRLAEQNPDDQPLNDFADSLDDATTQDIADAANAAKSDGSAGQSDSADGDNASLTTATTN